MNNDSRAGAFSDPQEDRHPALAPRVRVLGVGVSVINLQSAVEYLLAFVRRPAKQSGYVTVTGAHGVIESEDDPDFRDILNRALLCTPDGVPLVWAGQFYGHHSMGRVYGPDLMLELFRQTENTGIRHFFYGGKEGVAEILADRLMERFPGSEICGTYTPPFRPLTEEEEGELMAQWERDRPEYSEAGTIHVGLG